MVAIPLPRHAAGLGETRFLRLSIHKGPAGRALSFAAAELGSRKIEVVAQNAE
jgi:hypothetical protein